MPISTPNSQLIGVFLESLAYGIYLSIFMQCIQVLRRRRSSGGYLIGTTVSLFVLITAHLVVDLMRTVDAFTSNMEIPNYPFKYFAHFDTWEDILKSALYVAATIVSDAFIVYRSFIVWNRSYLITIIPFLLFLADIAIGIFWVYTITLTPTGANVFTDDLGLRVKVFYSITLGMNVICTCLIAYKIWKIQRTVSRFAKGNQNEASRVVPIIIESGAFYSAYLVAMIVTYVNRSPAMFIFLNSMCPVIGIVFSSVIVRVGLGLSHGDAHHVTSNSATSIRSSALQWIRGQTTSGEPFFSGSQRPLSGGIRGSHGVQIALSQTIHTHVDGDPSEVDTDWHVGSADAKEELHMV